MNILQVGTGIVKIPPQRYGGTESHIFNTARHMVRAGHQITIVDIKESATDPDMEDIAGIKFVRLTPLKITMPSRSFTVSYILSRINTILFALKANRYIKKSAFDVIHVHGPLIGLVLASLSRKQAAKMVYSDYSPSWFMPSLGRQDRLTLSLAQYLMSRVALVTVQNNTVKARLITEGKVTPERIAVVHTGVEISQYSPDIATADIRERYELKKGITILFNGRIVPYKGVEYLVKAADIIVNRFGRKDVLFLLVGPLAEHGLDQLEHASYTARILSLIKEYRLEGNMRLTGAVPLADLPGLFTACDIFVLPSLFEASPQVVAQAMASARPVVGTRITGVDELVRDGSNGYLVEPANEHQLAEKLKYLIDHPEERLRMGLDGRKFALEELDWSQVSRSILQSYEAMRTNEKI